MWWLMGFVVVVVVVILFCSIGTQLMFFNHSQKYLLQVIDFQDANLSERDNIIEFASEEVMAVDHVYALIRKPDGRYVFEYPHTESHEASQVLMYPNKRQKCSVGGTQKHIKGTHTPHGSPQLELWDVFPEVKKIPNFGVDSWGHPTDSFIWSSLIYVCADDPQWMLKPVGTVYVTPSARTTTTTPAAPVWGPGVTAPP